MAEETSDAMLAVTTDVEMKEEPPAEEPLNGIHQVTVPTQPLTAPLSVPNNAVTPPAGLASSARPGSQTPVVSVRPEKPVAHGGPTRQYLNSNVTPHLLEGMKYLAMHEPEKPLLWLSEFLRDKSAEIESAGEKAPS